ncbi:flagellin N-terminal helical domain-containing protein [Vibrio parahaemolyticus]|uniref:flagellin N-terminal helical domain-containing protein n=1 Tax=Vibrio parahaemolyticus TaxID=670 RepID=UPI001121AC03|nr:flagellin [Vibrio parahaemolyticus]TOA40199.1 flagellin [Vibrio parahaemolyticus]HCG8767558.1 flagellin [Vibrio parahaemolyticus]
MMTSISSINTNAPAMQYQSQLTRSIDKQNTSMERLSSGLKINTAKDDAAGLQISNRLQVQSRGMDVAIRNANDGISVLQTAEGAMKEYTENLMQMRDLALRFDNGSLNSSDRNAITLEYEALVDELARLTDTTSYAGKKILNGSSGSQSFQIGASSGEAINIDLPNLNSMKGDTVTQRTTYYAPIQNHFSDNWKSPPEMKIGAYITTYHPDKHYTTETEYLLAEPETGSSFQDVVDELNNKYGDKATFYLDRSFKDTLEDRDVGEADKLRLCFYPNDETAYMHFQVRYSPISGVHGRYPFFYAGGRSYEENVHNELTIPTLDKGAQAAISSLDKLISFVDSKRAMLGSAQNRLSHAINNLSQSSENVADSHSQIRDTDFAKESAKLAKQSILREVNTSILAQAGNTPRSALNLLS